MTNKNGGVIELIEEPLIKAEIDIQVPSNGSHISWAASIFSKETNGASNLVSVLEGPFKVDIDYSMVDAAGALVSHLKQEAVCDTLDLDEGLLAAKVGIYGWYKGPAKVDGSPGYAIYLRQIAPGLIEGVYGQPMLYDGDKAFYTFCRRRYSYESGKTLPFDEIWHYKILSARTFSDNGNRVLDFEAEAYYGPAEAHRLTGSMVG